MADRSLSAVAAAPALPRRAGRMAMQALVLLHRYLGIGLGLLMVLWCLSGFVMLYAAFPELTAAERVAGLAPLALQDCCDPSRIELRDDTPVSDLRIEMLAGEPVVRVSTSPLRAQVFRLRTGAPLDYVMREDAAAVARDFARGAGIAGRPLPPQEIDHDQWTVSNADRNAPVYKVAFDDRAGTEIYVSGSSGQVFQDTNRKERILGWLGPVPHWLYPSLLRRNNALWSQVVIWSSSVGVFLTAAGIWLGVARFKRYRSGRWSPFRGAHWQHHIAGLIFGLFTLTWVFSGLMTMGPWGLMRGGGAETRRALVGETTWAEARRLVALAPALATPGVVQIEGALLGGKLYALAVRPDGTATRYDLSGRPAPLQTGEIATAVQAMGAKVASLDLLTREDAYYYGHRSTPTFPVQRLVLDDAEATRLYIHPGTGKVVRVIDSGARQRRWWESALHDLDLPVLRNRPVWDLVVIPLLIGVTFVCATGVWIGVRRITGGGSRPRSP